MPTLFTISKPPIYPQELLNRQLSGVYEPKKEFQIYKDNQSFFYLGKDGKKNELMKKDLSGYEIKVLETCTNQDVLNLIEKAKNLGVNTLSIDFSKSNLTLPEVRSIKESAHETKLRIVGISIRYPDYYDIYSNEPTNQLIDEIRTFISSIKQDLRIVTTNLFETYFCEDQIADAIFDLGEQVDTSSLIVSQEKALKFAQSGRKIGFYTENRNEAFSNLPASLLRYRAQITSSFFDILEEEGANPLMSGIVEFNAKGEIVAFNSPYKKYSGTNMQIAENGSPTSCNELLIILPGGKTEKYSGTNMQIGANGYTTSCDEFLRTFQNGNTEKYSGTNMQIDADGYTTSCDEFLRTFPSGNTEKYSGNVQIGANESPTSCDELLITFPSGNTEKYSGNVQIGTNGRLTSFNELLRTSTNGNTEKYSGNVQIGANGRTTSCDELLITFPSGNTEKHSGNVQIGTNGHTTSCNELLITFADAETEKYSGNVQIGANGRRTSCDELLITFPNGNTEKHSGNVQIGTNGRITSCNEFLRTFTNGILIKYSGNLQIGANGRPTSCDELLITFPSGNTAKYSGNLQIGANRNPTSYNELLITFADAETAKYSGLESLKINLVEGEITSFEINKEDKKFEFDLSQRKAGDQDQKRSKLQNLTASDIRENFMGQGKLLENELFKNLINLLAGGSKEDPFDKLRENYTEKVHNLSPSSTPIKPSSPTIDTLGRGQDH